MHKFEYNGPVLIILRRTTYTFLVGSEKWELHNQNICMQLAIINIHKEIIRF